LNLHGTPPSPKKCQRFVNLCRAKARDLGVLGA